MLSNQNWLRSDGRQRIWQQWPADIEQMFPKFPDKGQGSANAAAHDTLRIISAQIWLHFSTSGEELSEIDRFFYKVSSGSLTGIFRT